MPIHISMQTAFELRNAIFTADTLAPLLLLPLICVGIAWRARRDLWRALAWFATLALLFDLLDIALTVTIPPLQNSPQHLTLPLAFTVQALYNIAGASNQLAYTLTIIASALGLLLAARHGWWAWLAILATATFVASLGHALVTNLGLPMLNSLHLSSTTAAVAVALLEALAPAAAWIFAARAKSLDATAAPDADSEKAPSHAR